jgi:microcystin-dependent protein
MTVPTLDLDRGDIVAGQSVFASTAIVRIDQLEAWAAIVRDAVNDQGSLPIGTVTEFAGADLPDGWLWCDGESKVRATYQALFDVILTVYGSVDGSTFNVPDMKGRVPIGVGTGDADDATNHTLGEVEGFETHTLLIEEMPEHNHPGVPFWTPTGTGTNIAKSGGTVDSNAEVPLQGDDEAHNNLQPSLGLNFIIKYS